MKNQSEAPRELIAPGELRLLLQSLHGHIAPDPYEDHVTVASVSEATGESEQRVWDVLESIRANDLRSRLVTRLAEAEEPLYRVERPGIARDPLASNTRMGRHVAMSSLLDHLPRPNRLRAEPKHKKVGETLQERLGRWMSLLLLLLLLGTLALIIIRALRQGSI